MPAKVAITSETCLPRERFCGLALLKRSGWAAHGKMAGRSRPVSECAVIGPVACSRYGISGLKGIVSFAGFAAKNPAAKARGGVTQLNVMIMKKIPRPRYRNAIGNLSIERNGAPSYCTLRKRIGGAAAFRLRIGPGNRE